MSSLLAQTRFDIANWMRNGEQVILNVLLPLLALAGSTKLNLSPSERGALLPLFAISASSFTSIAIATAFDRRAGALKVYGMTPLGRRGFVQARVLTALVISAVQVGAVVALAYVAHIEVAVTATVLAAAALSVIGWISFALLLASVLRAEAVLAIANLIFLAAAPAAWFSVATYPWLAIVTPLSSAYAAVSGSVIGWVALGLWSLAGMAIAINRFRWE